MFDYVIVLPQLLLFYPNLSSSSRFHLQAALRSPGECSAPLHTLCSAGQGSAWRTAVAQGLPCREKEQRKPFLPPVVERPGRAQASPNPTQTEKLWPGLVNLFSRNSSPTHLMHRASCAFTGSSGRRRTCFGWSPRSSSLDSPALCQSAMAATPLCLPDKSRGYLPYRNPERFLNFNKCPKYT